MTDHDFRSGRSSAVPSASVAVLNDIAYDAEEKMVQEWMLRHFDRLSALQLPTLTSPFNTPLPTAPARPDW